MSVLLVRLLCAAVVIITVVQAQLNNGLLPNNPVVEIGGTLVLNCTLSDEQLRESRVEDIYFTPEKFLNNTHVYILDDRTAQLRQPNVTEELNQKFLACRRRNVTSGFVGMQIVTVRIKPRVPKITKCVVSDSSLQCEWSPTGEEQMKYIGHKVHDFVQWSRSGDPEKGAVHTCSKQDVGKCTLTQEEFVRDDIYTFILSAFYDHSSSNGTYIIDSSQIVLVSPVANIAIEHLSPTSVVLEWPAVESNQDIIYRMNFSQTALGYENVTKTLEVLFMKLDGLKPFQPYDFTLEAKTKHHGYWSDPHKSRFFALSDVPAKHPDVQEGGFSVVEKDGNPCIDVTVYWKPIELVDQHGPEFKYEVDTEKIGECGMGCFSWEKRANRLQATIPKNCTVDFRVKSVNSNGTSTAPITPVRIDPSNKRIHGPSNITVIASVDGKEVIVTWNKEPNDTATTGYTLYWSPRHFNSLAEMNWKAVPADTNQIIQPLTAHDYTKFEFAMSREEGSRTSGMVISDCTYQDGQYSPPPKDFAISKTAEPENGEMILEWRPPQCSIHRGFIYGYALHYCETSEEACPGDLSQQKTMFVSGSETHVTLTGLTEKARHCVTISSLTSKGPSLVQSEPQCAVVPGPWWTPGIITGFVLGGIVVLLLVLFGIIRFGSHCHRLYSKFQRGIRVELPRTTYSTQFSVSSHKELIDQNHRFSYNVEDYSSPGLAKQHSQDSTADSGRGSMTQDHIHPSMRRSNSGESDEVFLAKNGLQANGTARTRQLSEPMGSYARVTHSSEPQVPSNSASSLVTPSPSGRPKLPARNSPVDGTVSNSISSLPQHYNSSIANGSIPSYVMVAGNSQAGGNYSPNEDASIRDGSVTSSPISDYTRANGETPILNYIMPENQGQEEYIQTPTAGQDFHPALLRQQEPDNQGNLGYITSPEAANLGAPVGYVSSPDATTPGAPLGYVTSPEAANLGAPLGYVTSPEAANLRTPLGYVTSPEAANLASTFGYVTSPETVNQGAATDRATIPESANQGAPSGYVRTPETANSGTPLGYVTSPEAANQGTPCGYVASPEAASHGTPCGYVASPEAASHGTPCGYVASPEAANQGTPLGYVTSPEAANQGTPLGYVTSPEAANQGHAMGPGVASVSRNLPPGYSTYPELTTSQTGQTRPANCPGAYVSPSELINMERGSPGLVPDTGGYVSAPGTDYVQNSNVSPLVAPTPHDLTDRSQRPPWDSDRDSALCKPQQLQKQLPHVDAAYVSLPPSTDSTCNSMTNSVPPTKEIQSRNSDANHNEVAKSGVYVKPASENDMGHSSDLLSTQRSNELQTDISEDSDETSSLLPSDGGHRVLNKSGYVVIDT